jgi:hypothetical protein
MANFTKSNMTITPKWLLKNETKTRFDLSIQRGFVWDAERKSLFINSLIEGYPVPAFYALDSTEDDFLWLLDGKQRLGTVLAYLKEEFALSKNTPNINDVDIAGLKFSELPEEFQDEIKNFGFNIWKFKNITELERDQLFYRLNYGMALSKMELTRVVASSKVMDFINDISAQEFFQLKVAISDSQKNRYVDEEVILQIISILMNGHNEGFSGKELKALALNLKENGIPENIQEIVKTTTNYLDQAIPVKEKFMKKLNIPIAFYIAQKAINDDVEPLKFGGFLQDFFANLPDAYYLATQSGSAKKENIKDRIDSMSKYYDENIKTAKEFKMPEIKPQSTSKRGRPSKENVVQINIQEDPIGMAASDNGSLS